MLLVVLLASLIPLAELVLWAAGFESFREMRPTGDGALHVARPKALVDDSDLGSALSPGLDGEIDGIRYRGGTFLDIEPLFDRTVQALETSSVGLLSASQATVSASRGRIFAGVYESIFSEVC